MKTTGKHIFGLLAIAGTLIFAQSISAQVIEEPGEGAGTTAFAEAPQLEADAAFAVKPALVLHAASYTTGGSEPAQQRRWQYQHKRAAGGADRRLHLLDGDQ
jgi:hypothetical protein